MCFVELTVRKCSIVLVCKNEGSSSPYEFLQTYVCYSYSSYNPFPDDVNYDTIKQMTIIFTASVLVDSFIRYDNVDIRRNAPTRTIKTIVKMPMISYQEIAR